jgi:hypothetical protein
LRSAASIVISKDLRVFYKVNPEGIFKCANINRHALNKIPALIKRYRITFFIGSRLLDIGQRPIMPTIIQKFPI